MNCPNCRNQVPVDANVCGYCGTHLNTAPTKKGLPGWAWGLIGALAGLILLFLCGVGYFLFMYEPGQPAQTVPQPAQVVTVTIEPPKMPPVQTEAPQQSVPQQPTATNTSPPPPPPAPPEDTQYCETFEAIDFDVVYMDWIPGAPLTFYVKMPGGVPGLEKKIPGVSEDWTYKVSIGDYQTESCDIIQGYKERLYCSVDLPSTYSNSIRSLQLEASACDTVVFEQQIVYLPGIEAPSGGGGNGGGGSSSGPSCGAAPPGGPGGCTGEYISWCSCMGGSYVCGFGGPICIVP